MSTSVFHAVNVDRVTPILEQLAIMKADGCGIDDRLLQPDVVYGTPKYARMPSVPPACCEASIVYLYAPNVDTHLRYADLQEALAFWRAQPELLRQRRMIIVGGTELVGAREHGDRLSLVFESVGSVVHLGLSRCASWWDDPDVLVAKR